MFNDLFWRKLKLQMKLLHIVEHRPNKKIKLDALTQDQLNIEKDVIRLWSQDNLQLYDQLLRNGMAQFICNRDNLYEFYKVIRFNKQKIEVIDSNVMKFKNLNILHLSQNRIATIQYLPSNCKELYIDFNCLQNIQLHHQHNLQLLSASHNKLNDSAINVLTSTFPELRCLNISHNSICKLKDFVNCLGNLHLLKILVALNNPISMLSIYYQYITQHIHLAYFDGAKYVKEQPKVQEPPPPPQKKQVKEEKKQAGKKDSKKGAKVEEKVVEEPPPVVQPPKPVKKQLTDEDFTKVKFSIQVGNLQEHSGVIIDASLFGSQIDPLKTQTCYWLKYELMGQTQQEKQKMLSFQSSTTDNGQVRLDMKCQIFKEFSVNQSNYHLFNQGFKIFVMQRQPKMIKDQETLEQKPELEEGQPVMVENTLGGFHIDFRSFHSLKKKIMSFKYRLFPKDAVDSPLFYDPYENEEEIIQKRKDDFQEKIRAQEEEKLRKAQQEQQMQAQKKGKDQKKGGGDKKGGKKDGKDAVSQKPKSQPCNYPTFQRTYSIIQNQKMFKGKQILCLKIEFQ